ncbi:MAG TPA: hypothetical protein V6D50_01135 [Chroococcales cyanobacterium]|jgi:hypothetical protein
MIRESLVILGIGAVVVGLAPKVYAQTTPSGSNNNSVTLSGESLRTIEGRNLSGDYQNFFTGTSSDTSQPSQGNSGTNIGRLRQSPQRSPLSTILNNDKVDVVFGDTLNSQDELADFSSSGDQGDSDRVKLQFQLGQ